MVFSHAFKSQVINTPWSKSQEGKIRRPLSGFYFENFGREKWDSVETIIQMVFYAYFPRYIIIWRKIFRVPFLSLLANCTIPEKLHSFEVENFYHQFIAN